MRTSALLLAPLFVLCGCNGGSGDGPARPDLGVPDAGPTGTDLGPPDTGAGPVDLGPAQELSAMLTSDACGMLHAAATVDVPVGSSVTICAGSIVTFDAGASLRVHGTLHIAGTASSRVTLAATGARWSGLISYGTLDAHFFDMTGASNGLQTLAGATTTVTDSTFTMPSGAMAFNIGGGATVDRSQVMGGATSEISGGMLSMTDSSIDLMVPVGVPGDCTNFDGGGVTLDHVHFTRCHCPLHFNHTSMPIMVTNSILDMAVDPVMITESTATVHNNALLGIGVEFLDIGGNATADIGMNYWGGPHANFSAMSSSTFTGTGDAEVLTSMPAGIGPR